MQGHHPAVYSQTPRQTATSGTTQNVNRDWTCKRWFNNIADKVAAKTHQYFGKFVAVATLPFTFIPSLACDLFYGTKSLYQRTVSKAPVQSQVSTRGTPASRPEATQRQSGNPVLPTSVEPEILPVHPTANPAIKRCRHNKLYWKKKATELEISVNEKIKELATQEELVSKLRCELDHQRLVAGMLRDDFEEMLNDNNMLRRRIVEQRATDPVLVTDEQLFSNNGSLSSTDEDSGASGNVTIIVKEFDDSAVGDGADIHPAHKEATAELDDVKGTGETNGEECPKIITPGSNATDPTAGESAQPD